LEVFLGSHDGLEDVEEVLAGEDLGSDEAFVAHLDVGFVAEFASDGLVESAVAVEHLVQTLVILGEQVSHHLLVDIVIVGLSLLFLVLPCLLQVVAVLLFDLLILLLAFVIFLLLFFLLLIELLVPVFLLLLEVLAHATLLLLHDDLQLLLLLLFALLILLLLLCALLLLFLLPLLPLLIALCSHLLQEDLLRLVFLLLAGHLLFPLLLALLLSLLYLLGLLILHLVQLSLEQLLSLLQLLVGLLLEPDLLLLLNESLLQDLVHYLLLDQLLSIWEGIQPLLHSNQHLLKHICCLQHKASLVLGSLSHFNLQVHTQKRLYLLDSPTY
jgi:hypothetical protein